MAAHYCECNSGACCCALSSCGRGQRKRMTRHELGEGTPHPTNRGSEFTLALSRKGRGHNNQRPQRTGMTATRFDTHSGLMLAALTRSRHCGSSRAIRLANSAVVPPTGSTPMPGETLDHVGRARRAGAGGGELVDHRLRRAGRRHHADPQDALVARQAHLGDGRRVGHQLGACAAGDAEHAELAGGDVRIARSRRCRA